MPNHTFNDVDVSSDESGLKKSPIFILVFQSRSRLES